MNSAQRRRLSRRFGRTLLLALTIGAGTAVAAMSAATLLSPSPAPPASDDLFARSIGGPYQLIDHHGRPRTERDPDGRAQLVFFGFTRCEAMCGLTLPSIAEAADQLTAAGHPARPILITIDPAGDTPAALKDWLGGLDPDLLGLTGDASALAAARRAFNVSAERLGEAPDGTPIYAHGLYIYLLDAEGRFQTLLPPILPPEKIAEIAGRYLAP